MKLTASASIELELQMKDVLAFIIDEKLTEQQYDLIILEALRRKKGYFTMNDQEKFEIFEREKDKFTPTEFELRLK